MPEPPDILFLDGPGSAGKSTLAAALQRRARLPYLHVAMDAFIDMLPASYEDHPDGLRFAPDPADPAALAIHVGPVARRLFDGMQAAVRALAETGNRLIVDEVMLGDTRAGYARRLAGFATARVFLTAPLATLEARERARGDRRPGLSRWQHPRLAPAPGDLVIDTALTTPDAAAALICDRLGL